MMSEIPNQRALTLSCISGLSLSRPMVGNVTAPKFHVISFSVNLNSKDERRTDRTTSDKDNLVRTCNRGHHEHYLLISSWENLKPMHDLVPPENDILHTTRGNLGKHNTTTATQNREATDMFE